jgi:hypothetical protein
MDGIIRARHRRVISRFGPLVARFQRKYQAFAIISLGAISLPDRALGTHGDDPLERSSMGTSRQASLPPPSRSLRRAPIATSSRSSSIGLGLWLIKGRRQNALGTRRC